MFVCPFCKLNILADKNSLFCESCKRVFIIKEGIPIFSETTEGCDLSEVEKLIEKLKSMKDSDFDNLAGRFRLPVHKYNLAERYSENKSLKTFFSRFPDLSHMRILTPSAGAGLEAQILLERGADNIYFGDISLTAVSYAKNTFEKFYPQSKLHYFTANVEYLPFLDNYFDILFIYGSAHHYANFNSFLKEAARVSKNICLITEPRKMVHIQWIADKLNWNTEYGNIKTVRFGEDELMQKCSEFGLECQTEKMWQYYPSSLEKLGNNKIFIKIWFFFLKFLDIFLGQEAHSINLFAKKP